MVAVYMKKVLDGPVGLRNGTQNVTNRMTDQEKVIDLLANITGANGGKQESWATDRPLQAFDGYCCPRLVPAIRDFQLHWKRLGRLNVVDSVVDRDGSSLRLMNDLAGRNGPPPPPAPAPQRPPFIVNPRQWGTWQITNAWSATLGEVGQVGAVQLDVAQPDNQKFRMTGFGAGFGGGIDPIAYADLLRRVSPAAGSWLTQFAGMFARGMGFNLGDYLQKLGLNLASVTSGRIIANPLNRFFNRPTAVTRYMIAGGVRPPFSVISASGGIGAGVEAGLVMFGLPDLINCTAFAVYGSAGVTLKVGVGTQALLYSCEKVENL